MGTCPVPNSFSTASSTALPSVDSRSHFRISPTGDGHGHLSPVLA